MLLRLDGIAKGFGGRTLFRDVSLAVKAGDRIGLVGPNGAGKTTLLHIMAGAGAADSGEVTLPRAVRAAMLRQEVDPTRERTVREEVGEAFSSLDALEVELRDLEEEMARLGREGAAIPHSLADRYDRSHAAFDFGGGFEREVRVERVLDGLGFEPEARGRRLSTVSGGWLMRVELAKLLLSSPDVLLLDEPTNHLDLPSIEWFEGVLTEHRGAVVIISHDRTFLRRHVGRVLELEAGRATLYEGSYDDYLRQKEERVALLVAQKKNQDRQIAETERFVERFRYKASKARQVQSRVKALDKLERVLVPHAGHRSMRLVLPKPVRSGDEVMRLEGFHKRYGDVPVYRGVDFGVRRGERVALVGPNGAGKSTLLRIVAGELPIDAGTRHPGHKVTLAFYAQHQLEVLDPGRTVLEEIETEAQSEDVPRLRGQLGAFLFSGDDVEKKVSVLSGGEKARLALAKMLLRPSNFLVLDEPTNHLDVAACEVLENALRTYDGTLLFISHDRTFINALATRVVDVRHGTLTDYLGDYDRYLEKQEGGAASAEANAGSEPASESAAKQRKQARIADRRRERERLRTLQRARRSLTAIEADLIEREEELEDLSNQLTEPHIYRDGEAVRSIEVARAELQTAIEEGYANWESIAAEIETAEAAGES